MKKSTKAKWVVGIAGTAFSAFVLGQIGSSDVNTGNSNQGALKVDSKVYAAMEDREKELVDLDWSNYTITEGTGLGGAVQSDRQSRRS